MEVKAGYRQTEVGVIPEDWTVESVQNIGHIKTGPFGTILKASEYSVGEGTPLICMRDIGDGTLQVDDHTPLVPPSVVKRLPEYLLNGGDIVFGRKGAINRSALVTENQTGWFLGTDGIRIRPTKSFHSPYISYQFQRKEIQSWLLRHATGTTMPSLNPEMLRRLSLPFPPLPEQRAIATALSDVDALITSLDKLIAKKRDIKQAAMQELLTGKRRLPGFREEWNVKQLGEMGDISGAGVDKKCRQEEVPVRLVNYLDVYRRDFLFSKDFNHWVTARPDQTIHCDVKKGDVFFTPSSETQDDIGVSAVAMEDIPDAVYSYHIVRFRLRDEWDLLFRAYAFKTKAFLDEAQRQCEGSGTRYTISLGKFRNMTVQVPSIAEQRTIAIVLSDMDADLTALEQKRDKTKAIKQGMMQELLTGRIRLV
jgi:type I restriction enzyme S subunit